MSALGPREDLRDDGDAADDGAGRMAGARLGLDVGGTKIEGVALAETGETTARVRLDTVPGRAGILCAVREAVEQLRGDSAPPRSLGIGIPGQVDAAGGRVRHAVNLQLRDLDIRGALEQELGIPVRVENDVNAATLGAHWLRGRRTESMGYLNLGTGVAAGVVIEGELWRGTRGAAGEIGHFSVDPRGARCSCGQRGCIETLTGGRAVARAWGKPGPLPLRDMFDAAERGDPWAERLRGGVARGVAAAVQLLVLSVDVSTVVLGGGVSSLGDRLLKVVREDLEQAAAESPFLRSLELGQRIGVLPPEQRAAALGAALIGEEPLTARAGVPAVSAMEERTW